MKVKPLSGRTILLVVLTVAFLFYTVFIRAFIGSLRDQTEQVSTVYAELISSSLKEGMSRDEQITVLNWVFSNANNPVIVMDEKKRPLYWANIHIGESESSPFAMQVCLSSEEMRELEKKASKYRRKFSPRVIYLRDNGRRWGELVFGSNPFIDSLFWMPFLEVGLLFGIIVTTYMSFRNVRITERSNLWVGLAKETAHQLGTPISSLMGWVEYLKSVREVPVEKEELLGQVEKICSDMEYDLKRLRKVTARFSHIGSVPALSKCSINEVLSDVIDYFQIRLPLHRRRIKIEVSYGQIPVVALNRELLEWVFENLMKNSIDAIQKPEGIIEIRTEFVSCDNIVRITHRDNGKGILREDQKKIFAPGFTTKKRGWGLGLTLAKRIIEDYHGGQIYVSWSQKDKGAIFTIDLPVRWPEAGRLAEGAGQNVGNA